MGSTILIDIINVFCKKIKFKKKNSNQFYIQFEMRKRTI